MLEPANLAPAVQKPSTYASNTEAVQQKVNIDPIEIIMTTAADTVAVGTDIDLKIEVAFVPKLYTTVPYNWDTYTFKIMLPNGFEQTGGDYRDYTEGSFENSESKKHTYHLIGHFKPDADSMACFKAIRSTMGARNEDVFWLRSEKCLYLPTNPETAAFDPFLANKALMEGLKGKIPAEPASKLRAPADIFRISRTNKTNLLFTFCETIELQVSGAINPNNLKLYVQMEGSTIWNEMNYSEYFKSGDIYYIRRSEYGFLPSKNFSLKVGEGLSFTNSLTFTLIDIPVLSANKNNLYALDPLTLTISFPSGSTGVQDDYITLYNANTINGFSKIHRIIHALGLFQNSNYIIPHTYLSDEPFAAKFEGQHQFIIGRNENGCSYQTSTIGLTVTSKAVKIAATKENICTNETTTFTFPTCTNSFEWRTYTSIGLDGSNPTYTASTNPNQSFISVSQIGDYGVKCKTANGEEKMARITIGRSQTGCSAPSLNATTATSFCNGGSAGLAVNNCNSTPSWFKDGIGFANATTAFTATAGGSYTVTCTNGTTNAIVVNNSTPPAPGINVSGTVVTANTNVGLTLTSCENGRVKWFKGGVQIGGQTDKALLVTQAGIYTATCSSADGACESPSSGSVTITSSTVVPAVTLGLTASTSILCTVTNESVVLSLTGCSSAPAWYRDNAVTTGGTANNAAATKTFTTTTPGTYYTKCGTINSSSVTIGSNGSPQAPTIEADQTEFTYGETVVLTSKSGRVKWYDASNALLGEGVSITIAKQDCYYAKTSNDCGSSANSNTICANYRQIRIVSDKSEVLPNELATLTLLGCTGFVVWDNNGAYIPGQNPVSLPAGTYKATCAIQDGRQSPWVSITVAQKALETLTLSANKTEAFGNEDVTLTALGCTTGQVYWEVRGVGIWQRNITVKGGGVYKGSLLVF